MKTAIFSVVVAGMCAFTALAAPPFKCDFVCVKPEQNDPHAASTCNCAERYCPTPQGPGGPNIPAGDVWGWNETANACGPVPAGQQCAGLDVTCVSGYTYGWNGVDTCECLPEPTKRQVVCDIECVPPMAHDPNAISPSCNCAERVCPPGPECPVNTLFGWDNSKDACGCVKSPEKQCVKLGISCVAGYTYGWDGADSTCKCLAN